MILQQSPNQSPYLGGFQASHPLTDMLFLLGLELSGTHSVHNSPSLRVGSFLPIFLVLLILLQQTSVEDWLRMNEIPPSPSSMRLKDLASCFALG